VGARCGQMRRRLLVSQSRRPRGNFSLAAPVLEPLHHALLSAGGRGVDARLYRRGLKDLGAHNVAFCTFRDVVRVQVQVLERVLP